MSASARQLARVITRPVKKLQKPRPLKAPNVSRHSVIDSANISVFEEIMVLAEAVASNLSNRNFDRNLQSSIVSLSGLLKTYGQSLEVIYKAHLNVAISTLVSATAFIKRPICPKSTGSAIDLGRCFKSNQSLTTNQLDRAFVIFRNGCRDENLDYTSRLHLLELIELRAMQWTTADGTSYYKHKYNHPDVDILSVSSMDSSLSSASIFQNTQMLNSINSIMSQPLLLGPGELVKSSGKFAAPTKIPGKNYCKDEVVIRNSDSGKVMGIKGRRVHMIEELSETVISFQRVTPGAKERLVQITGPTEDKITYAKQLIEETIKRNASPVRSEMVDKERFGSTSSLNSSASEDSSKYGSLGDSLKRTTLLHSFSTSDATIGEYKYTVTIGDDTLKITGTNPNLVTIAKLVLDEYFLAESSEQLAENAFEDGANYFDRAYASENEEEIFKAMSPGIAKSPAFKDFDSANETVKISGTDKISSKEKSELTEEVIESESSPDLHSQRMKDVTCNPREIYTCEEILLLAESALSRQFPHDWAKICKEFPGIVKKPPIEWFDPRSYMKERPKESDAVVAIQSAVTVGTPEQE